MKTTDNPPQTCQEMPLEVIAKPELLQVSRAPEVVLEEAGRAAKALQQVINGKARKVILNGEQYLEFEDLLTLARFYGVSVKVEWSRPVEFGEAKGFEARATAFNSGTGQELSAADSMCLSDESNWKGKPLFMLRSMASTRACAKALRNVLAWVVVLAGSKPTPAEEMQEVHAPSGAAPSVKLPASKPEQQAFSGGPVTLVGTKTIPYTNKKTGKPSEFYAMSFRDAGGTELECATFDSKLAKVAEELAGKSVYMSYKPGRREGKFELVSLEGAEQTTSEEIEP